jgi:hypothetical protein
MCEHLGGGRTELTLCERENLFEKPANKREAEILADLKKRFGGNNPCP